LIGCQFSILLGTYYPRNTPPPLAQSVLGLPWLTIKASQASCLWFLLGGVATDVIFSRTFFFWPSPKSDNRKSPPPGFELRTSREIAVRFNAPAAVHSAKASIPMLHREKGYWLDVNSLYYWVLITHVTQTPFDAQAHTYTHKRTRELMNLYLPTHSRTRTSHIHKTYAHMHAHKIRRVQTHTIRKFKNKLACIWLSHIAAQAPLADQAQLLDAGRDAIARTFKEEGLCSDLFSHVLHEFTIGPEEWKRRCACVHVYHHLSMFETLRYWGGIVCGSCLHREKKRKGWKHQRIQPARLWLKSYTHTVCDRINRNFFADIPYICTRNM